MIDYKNKLLVTKELNRIAVKFTRAVIIRDLLTDYSFKDGELTNLLISINKKFLDSFNAGAGFDEQLSDYLTKYYNKLHNDSKMSLYYYIINEHYEFFDEEFNNYEVNKNITEDNIDEKFGRYLAQKLYNPDRTELSKHVLDFLNATLINFATEFDFSLIDNSTKQHVLETIEKYVQINI